MTRHSLAFFTSILLLLASNHAFATIYKWKNENGQIHYGSMPPPQGVPYQKMGINTTYTPTPAPKPKTVNPKSARNSSDKTPDDKKPAYTKEQQTTLCNSSKNDLATLNKNGRLRVKQEDGSTAVMSDKDRAARLKTMQDMMKKHCK